jgi:hypothetical protein
MLTNADLKVGLHVKCIYPICNGKTGVIKTIPTKEWHIFSILWDDGSNDFIYWGCPESFTLYESESQQLDNFAESHFGMTRRNVRTATIGCCTCRRVNDVAVKVCWYCGNSPTM